MNIYKIIIGLLGIFLLMLGCEKDDTNSKNHDINTIELNGESYNVSGYLFVPNDEEYEYALKISIRGSYVDEADTTSLVVVFKSFYLNFILVPLDSSSVEGSYIMGDLNGDGMVNELDVSETGYCSSATLEMGEVNLLNYGEIQLKEVMLNTTTSYDENGLPMSTSSDNSKGINIQFSLKDAYDRMVTGNVDLTDNRK